MGQDETDLSVCSENFQKKIRSVGYVLLLVLRDDNHALRRIVGSGG